MRHDEEGIRKMQNTFPVITEQQLRENMEIYNLDEVFKIVKEYFKRELNFDSRSILINNYQRALGSYFYPGLEQSSLVHVDELLESALIGFLSVMFIWDYEMQNPEVAGDCFRYVLFLMNEVCIFGEFPGENAIAQLMEIIRGHQHIVKLAEECYWTIMIFNIAHEIAHEYLGSIQKNDFSKLSDNEKRNILIQEEYQADRIAYDLVLKIMMNGTGRPLKLQEYSYLAPMMYMDFFELYYYTDRVLYKNQVLQVDHPSIKSRKKALFALANDDRYDFDTSSGNDLYNCFLYATDEYKDELLLKEQRGKLHPIIFTERRNAMKGVYNDKN